MKVEMVGGPDDGKSWEVDDRYPTLRLPFVPPLMESMADFAQAMETMPMALEFPIRTTKTKYVIRWKERKEIQ